MLDMLGNKKSEIFYLKNWIFFINYNFERTQDCLILILLLLGVHVVEVLAVLLGDDLEPGGLHVINPDNASRSCIPVGCVIDGSSAKVISLLISQVIPGERKSKLNIKT